MMTNTPEGRYFCPICGSHETAQCQGCRQWVCGPRRCRSAPRTWGSSQPLQRGHEGRIIRPTHVGIIPTPTRGHEGAFIRPTHVGIILKTSPLRP